MQHFTPLINQAAFMRLDGTITMIEALADAIDCPFQGKAMREAAMIARERLDELKSRAASVRPVQL